MTNDTGSLVLIPFPYTDFSDEKKRPVLILKEPDHFGDFICLAVTSKSTHTNTVTLTQEHLDSGTIPKPSWIRTDKIFTLNQRLIIKTIAKVKKSLMQETLKNICQSVAPYFKL